VEDEQELVVVRYLSNGVISDEIQTEKRVGVDVAYQSRFATGTT